jgi:hypothetical protein
MRAQIVDVNYEVCVVSLKVVKEKVIIPYTCLAEPLENYMVLCDGEIVPKNCIGKEHIILSAMPKASTKSILLFVYQPKSSNETKANIKSVLLEANDIVESRQAKYGDIAESFTEIALLCNLTFTKDEMTDGRMSTEKVLKTMKAVKLIRDKYSPDNPDHLRDELGYGAIQHKLRFE